MAKPKSAGIIFFTRDGRVLFTKRDSDAPEGGSWDFPGGGMEPDETPKEAARRETREEVGFDYDGPLLKVKKMSNGYVAYAAMLDEEFTPVLNDEHTDYVWATYDEVPRPLHPTTRKELKELEGMPLIEGKKSGKKSKLAMDSVGISESVASVRDVALMFERMAKRTKNL